MECMCNDCVKSTFKNVIEYLKYKNGELNEFLKSLKEDDDEMINFTKDEIKDISEMISDMKTIKNQIKDYE